LRILGFRVDFCFWFIRLSSSSRAQSGPAHFRISLKALGLVGRAVSRRAPLCDFVGARFFPAAGPEFSRFAPPQPECPLLSFSQSTASPGGSQFSVLGLRVSRRSAAAPCQVPAPPRARFRRSGVFSHASVPLALGLSGPSTPAPRRHNRCRALLLLRFSLRCCSRFRSQERARFFLPKQRRRVCCVEVCHRPRFLFADAANPASVSK
jgi:hypothetical protein